MTSLPRQVGHFEVLSELGRGGMGIVYKVRDTRSGAHCALKMIPPEALARPDSALRFKREFRAMQRVEHPNVIRVYEAGTHDGCPFFTMELVDGREIRRFVDGDTQIIPSDKDGPQNTLFSEAQRKRLNEPARVKRVADLVVQVAFALAEIHSHRIVHRDLKPDNILVSKAGVAKLMDFGIAKQLSANSEQSSGGMVVGTFKYLSPEQALGSDIDGRADLYCLGVILYELLTGRHPFYSENSVGYAFHHARKPPPDMEKFNPEVHRGLKAVCEKLIKKDPRDRYATAEDVIAAIRAVVDDEASGANAPSRNDDTNLRQRVGPYDLAQDLLFAPALVGRGAELRQLHQAIDPLTSGRGGVVVVSGPAGIGKTRLLREAEATAREKQITFVHGTCREHGEPYQPFVDILSAIVGEQRARPAADFARLLGDDGRAIARYVPALLELDAATRPRPLAALEPQGERLRFLGAVTSFLGRIAAAGPRVLVVDALHFADELSLGLVEHLANTLARGEVEAGGARAAPIVLALAFDPGHPRAADAASLVARLSSPGLDAGAQRPLHLTLPPLPVGDVQEMLASMLGGGDVAGALAESVHGQTGGVPGPIDDLVRAWVDSGELRRSTSKGRRWVFVKRGRPQAAEGSGAPEVVEVRQATRWDIPVADFAENPSQKRIARLSALARDVAERLAVAGDRVDAGLAFRIALRTEDEFLDALDELLKRSIVVDENEGQTYRFTEHEDRRALQASLRRERAQQLHLLVARALEEEARQHRRPPNPEELGAHFLEAGEAVRAIEQMMVAARNALAASATQTAAQRVREAQELLGTEQKTSDVQQTMPAHALVRADLELVLLRLDVLAAVNEHKECVSLARRRLSKVGAGVDGRLVAELLLRLASSERLQGDLDAALEHTAQVLSRTERGGAHGLRCRAKSLCGQLYEQRGQIDVANRYYSDALELARTIGDETEEERARWAIAARDFIVGNLEDSSRTFEALLHAATTRGEKLRMSQYLSALGMIAWECARFDDAEQSWRKVIEFAKPAGDRRTLATALHNIALVRLEEERFDDAFALTSRAAKILLDLDQVESLSAVRIVESELLLARHARTPTSNDVGDALKKADEALDLALKSRASLKVAEAALCRGLALCRKGDVVGRDDIARGLHTAQMASANRLSLLGQQYRAEAEVLSGEHDAAQATLMEARARAEGTGFLRSARALAATQARLRLA